MSKNKANSQVPKIKGTNTPIKNEDLEQFNPEVAEIIQGLPEEKKDI
jgi:hypothetical protein